MSIGPAPHPRRNLLFLGAALVLGASIAAYALNWRGQQEAARRGYESFLFEYARRCDASAFRFPITELGIHRYLGSAALRQVVDDQRTQLVSGASCDSVDSALRAADFPMPPRRPDTQRQDVTAPTPAPAAALASPSPLPSPATSNEPSPSPRLSKKVRRVIQRRMDGHSKRMGKLVSAVWFVDYADAARAADALVDQSQLRKDLARDAVDLEFTFPDRFFTLLLELESRTAVIAEAARRKDGAQLASGFARLSETCINCHAEYLEER